MKKCLLILSFGLGVVCQGQTAGLSFKSYSFLNCQSLQVSNTIQVTNLLSFNNTTQSNVTGTVFTNLAGSKVTSAPGTADFVNLLKIVPLWDTGGGMYTPIYTNQAPGATLMAGPYYNASIFIRLVGGSGANAAVTFRFTPVPSAYNPVTRAYPDWTQFGLDEGVAADVQTISVTATTTTEIKSRTLLDLSKFVGCAGIMCQLINNADTDASSAVQVLECSLNAFTP